MLTDQVFEVLHNKHGGSCTIWDNIAQPEAIMFGLHSVTTNS